MLRGAGDEDSAEKNKREQHMKQEKPGNCRSQSVLRRKS